MKTDIILCGGGVRLRQITLQDCNETYVQWLNDPEVIKYLETRWYRQDLDTIKAFVQSQLDNDHSVLFAIETEETKRHIGNIKIGPINRHHKHADISYFIGDKSYWRKGISTKAIHLVCQYGFKNLSLHRIEAGAYSAAIGSWKALQKNGFKREAVFREQVISGDCYMDIYRYGLLESEYQYFIENGGK